MSLLSKAFDHAAHEASKLVGDAANGGQDVADAFAKAGKKLIDAVDDFGKGLIQIFEDNVIGIRNLRPEEKAVIRRIYSTSLPPLDNVLVVSLTGIGNRPFTMPASFLRTLATPLLGPVDLALLLLLLVDKHSDRYLLFLGRHGYNDALNQYYYNRYGDILVHEMCHVWQGYNMSFTWEYIFNSVYNQVSGGAYDYEVGKQWDEYGAEQQGKIVEHWYAGYDPDTNMLGTPEAVDNARYPYVAFNVQPGDPFATTPLPP